MRLAPTARFATAALTVSLALCGCGSGGSTSSSHETTSTVAKVGQSRFILIGVRNDTSAAVSFDQCQSTCGTLHEHRPIAAGSSITILGLNDGTPFADVVESAAGKRLGCVYMKYDHVSGRPVVLVSSMTACKPG